jgi:ATP-dependent DNA helicase RecQ
LRAWRRRTAAAREIAPFMVFSDLTLRDLARCRPSTAERLRQIAGIGEKKSAEYGTDILRLIAEHCRQSGLELDVAKPAGSTAVLVPGAPIGGKSQAFPLFAKGQNVEQVAATIGRARSTVSNYLAEYIEHERVVDPSPWVDEETLEQVRRAAQSVGWDRMKPIFEILRGAVSYESIRIAAACLRNRASIEPQLAEPT